MHFTDVMSQKEVMHKNDQIGSNCINSQKYAQLNVRILF